MMTMTPEQAFSFAQKYMGFSNPKQGVSCIYNDAGEGNYHEKFYYEDEQAVANELAKAGFSSVEDALEKTAA